MFKFVDLYEKRNSDIHIRPYQGDGDLQAMQAVLHACGITHSVDTELDAIPSEVAYTSSPDLERDVLIAERSGAVIGYGWMRWWAQPDGAWMYYHRGHLHPDHHGHGIGTRLLTHIEQHLRDQAGWHSRSTPVYFGADVATRATSRLLTTFDYRPVHTVHEMVLPAEARLPTPYLPYGYEVRPATRDDAEAIWRLKTANWQRPANGLDFRAFTQELNHKLALVVVEGERVTGAAVAEIKRGVAYITDLLTTTTDLERSLLLHTAHALRERGAGEIRLFAEARTMLHETVGFRDIQAYTRYQKEMPI